MHVREAAVSGRPFLGICLGMQILFERSEEDGGVETLGVIPGRVRRFPDVPGFKVPEIDWKTLSQMTFYSADDETFRCLAACKRAMKKGGLYPAVANGANEVANRLFRDGKITFLQIGELVSAAVDGLNVGKAADLDDVLAADRPAREFVYQNI